MIFNLLDYNKIHKKQKFSALDIVESPAKTCGLFYIYLCWHNGRSFFSLTQQLILLFVDVPTRKLRIIILPTDRPDIIHQTALTTKSCLRLISTIILKCCEYHKGPKYSFYFLNVFNKIYFLIAIFILSACEFSTFFLRNGIFKT